MAPPTSFDLAAFIWGFAEATLFFIVPDVLLSYIGLKRGAKAAALASLYAALGAGVGGALMFAWSAANADVARDAVLAVPAIDETMAAAAATSIETHGWFVATLMGPLATTPYKLYAFLAPHAGAPFLLFAAASILARLPRFLIVGAGVAFIGRWLEPWLGARRLVWVLAGAWALFYIAYFATHPS
jgi:membrane protein YqaA with SNARE-associated domain